LEEPISSLSNWDVTSDRFLLSQCSDTSDTESYYTESEEDISDTEAEPQVPPLSLKHRGTIYTLSHRLGEGSTSHVLMARARFPDGCEEQDVAIKVISKSVQAYRLGQGRIKHLDWTTMVATTETINSETEILKGFLDSGEHGPFLKPLLAAFQDNTNVYLVMVRGFGHILSTY
jgi:hypothetical protein